MTEYIPSFGCWQNIYHHLVAGRIYTIIWLLAEYVPSFGCWQNIYHHLVAGKIYTIIWLLAEYVPSFGCWQNIYYHLVAGRICTLIWLLAEYIPSFGCYFKWQNTIIWLLFHMTEYHCFIVMPPTKLWVGIKICTSPLVCATPPTLLDGFCSLYSHTVTNSTWRWP